jgi:hypothetical protein
LLAKYDAILAETQDVIRAVETTLQTKQGELLATRGAEVKALYDLLNPGNCSPGVSGLHGEPRTTALG